MITVRRAEAPDAEPICRLHAASIRRLCSSAYPAAKIAAWSGALEPHRYLPAMERFEFLVAELEGVVGFCILDLEHAELNALYVHPDAAGRGVGSRLLGHAEALARCRAVQVLRLKSTLNAAGFYEARGFRRLRDAIHASPAGVELACVEMIKEL